MHFGTAHFSHFMPRCHNIPVGNLDMYYSAPNEYFCMKILRAFGIWQNFYFTVSNSHGPRIKPFQIRGRGITSNIKDNFWKKSQAHWVVWIKTNGHFGDRMENI